MAICKICGKKGLFLKVNQNGVCADCVRLADIERREKEATVRLADKQKLIKETQDAALKDIEKDILQCNKELQRIRNTYAEDSAKLEELNLNLEKTNKSLETQSKKVAKVKELYKSIEYAVDVYSWAGSTNESVKIPNFNQQLEENLSPSVQIPLKCLNYKDLHKKFIENDKAITELTEKYKDRYNTKTITAIYKLMVIALRAELQNILSTLSYGKLDTTIDKIKLITSKYLAIATDGNQLIVSTLVRFIGQIEYLFIEAAKIEYEYYIQKEQIKEEQKALREQLRQEALEKKLLEQQQKQVAKEEEKYRNEIESLRASLKDASVERENILTLRIQQLEKQLADVDKKKAEIAKLQNGKAGYVYVISNLGSFGDEVFKIGMTRRLEPQERIDELGSASVPFPFDVHSFIFSDNAPELENSLHKVLHEKRLNKVNMRKEFFKVSLDELEKTVYEIQPTAEFNRTMLAEQYNQSISIASGIAVAFEDIMNNLNQIDDEETA